MTEPRFMSLTSCSVISLGAAAPGTSTAPITRSASQHVVLDRLARREDGVDGGAELLVDGVEPLDVDVEHGHLRLEADGHARGVDAGRRRRRAPPPWPGATPATPPSSMPRPPCSISRQWAPAWIGHAAGDLAHRRQQRQAAARARHRLVGDGGHARAISALACVGIRRQVQIGEERLALAQHGALCRLRLLHLDDQVGLGEDLRRRRRAPWRRRARSR